MKKLTGALVLSFSLLLASGCRSAGETKEPGDASTPAPSGAVDAARDTLNNGSGGTQAGSDSDSGTSTGAGSDPAAATRTGTSGGTTAAPLAEDARAAQETCLDKWLNMRKMDRYGSPEGTMYAGGSPLFNEQTGESTDRLEFVYKRHPKAKEACGNAGK
ncbi:MAG TPA: hypothetical protein VF815_16380 [Myxococcaceae bacterium]|jgi:hypothetical protein